MNVKINNMPSKDVSHDNPKDTDLFKKQFHPAFCAAMELELREDRDHLIFNDEFVLNSKPNSMDFLIINLNENIKVKSDLGAIFKKHNIFEFKSYKDGLNERVYHRTLGYVHLYIAYTENTISPEEITVTFLRETYPRKLMEYFKNNAFIVKEFKPGIYHIKKSEHVDMQIIVTGRLGNSFAWINKITKKLTREDVIKFQEELYNLHEEIDLINAESVIDLTISLNKDKNFIKEMIGMGALRDLFKEEFDEKDKKIQDLNDALQSKDEQIDKLLKENELLKKINGNKIAML